MAKPAHKVIVSKSEANENTISSVNSSNKVGTTLLAPSENNLAPNEPGIITQEGVGEPNEPVIEITEDTNEEKEPALVTKEESTSWNEPRWRERDLPTCINGNRYRNHERGYFNEEASWATSAGSAAESPHRDSTSMVNQTHS